MTSHSEPGLNERHALTWLILVDVLLSLKKIIPNVDIFRIVFDSLEPQMALTMKST